MSRAAPPVQYSRPIDPLPAFSPPFWLAIAPTGVLAGPGGGLLLRLLYAVQDVAWQERGEGLYHAFAHASATLTCSVLVGLGGGRLWSLAGWGDAPDGYAVVGAAALLAAATAGPLSAVTAVLELGRHIDGLIAPILLASAGACLVMQISDCPPSTRCGSAANARRCSSDHATHVHDICRFWSAPVHPIGVRGA